MRHLAQLENLPEFYRTVWAGRSWASVASEEVADAFKIPAGTGSKARWSLQKGGWIEVPGHFREGRSASGFPEATMSRWNRALGD